MNDQCGQLPLLVLQGHQVLVGLRERLRHPGDRLRTAQVLRSLSDPKTTKLGTGRFWLIDVIYTNQKDEYVGTESYTGFGYRRS